MIWYKSTKRNMECHNFDRELEKIMQFKCVEFSISYTKLQTRLGSSVLNLEIEINWGIYQGVKFKPTIYISKKYPIRQPLIYNHETFPHPNINQFTNEIVFSFLQEWNPTYYLSDVVYNLAATLTVPDVNTIPNNTLNKALCLDYNYRNSDTRHQKRLKEWAERNNKMEVEQLTMEVQEGNEEIVYEYELTKTCNYNFAVAKKANKELCDFSMNNLIFLIDSIELSQRKIKLDKQTIKTKMRE